MIQGGFPFTLRGRFFRSTDFPCHPKRFGKSALRSAPRRRGLTLIEALTAMTVVSVLLAMSVPSVMRTMEQVHADSAGANLKAIWNAQRYFWLENRTYAADLAVLQAAGLLDNAIVSGSSRYSFAIDSANSTSFVATASRIGSSVWSGNFTIDETGAVGGFVQKSGASYAITPGFD
jgi:type IV pilus assembly protein PilE